MRTDHDLHSDLLALQRSPGDRSVELRLGGWTLRLEGLDPAMAEELADRWGGYLFPASSPPTATLRILRSERRGWLEQEAPAETYRVEALNEEERRVVISYRFAVCADDAVDRWRVALASSDVEPVGRLIENAVRYLLARLAVDHGGFAVHGACILHEGRALIFTGPSGSGKTTAVGLVPDATSLGDDYAFVLPADGGWVTSALPFDNRERSRECPVAGWLPVAAIWRLYKADSLRLERPTSILAAASLVSCAALPWTMPERSGELMKQVQRFTGESVFAHLHFRRDSDLGPLVRSK